MTPPAPTTSVKPQATYRGEHRAEHRERDWPRKQANAQKPRARDLRHCRGVRPKMRITWEEAKELRDDVGREAINVLRTRTQSKMADEWI